MSLLANLAKHAHERFFFITGEVGDDFGLPQGRVDLLHLITLHLREQRYERIVYFSGNDKLCFADARVAATVLPQGCSVPVNKTYTPTDSFAPLRLAKGPLGHSRLSTQSSASAPVTPVSTSERPLRYGTMSDGEAIRTLDTWMRDDHVHTAVVITDGYDLIQHFDQDAVRFLSGAINQWQSLPGDNQNVCIIILPLTNQAELMKILDSIQGLATLRNHLFDSKAGLLKQNVTVVGRPGVDEIINTINYYRIKNGLLWPTKMTKQFIQKYAFKRWSDKEHPLRQLKPLVSDLSKMSGDLMTFLNAEEMPQVVVPALERLKALKGIGPVVAPKIDGIINLSRAHRRATPPPASNANTVLPERFNPRNKGVDRPNLHLALVGNPGTGKTETARLIAEVYREEGLLDSGHLVEVSKTDLVGQYVGETPIKTQLRINDAMGGVLFIDEAYSLAEEGDGAKYGQEAIDTLMKQMSDREGEFAVIIAGYEDKITSLFKTNQGLPRRFGQSNIIRLPDYSPELLQEIFEDMVQATSSLKLAIDDELRLCLPNFFKRWHAARDKQSFGNVGYVKRLLSDMSESALSRARKDPTTASDLPLLLGIADIPNNLKDYVVKPSEEENLEQILTALDSLVGLEGVKRNIRSLVNDIRVEQRRKSGVSLVPGHYLFKGGPGTGKTTVARQLGRIFWQLGLLGRGQCVEVTRSGLVAEYSGQTAPKTEAKCQEALDGVLFIDEAHQLIHDEGSGDSFGIEAVGALNKFMEDNRDRICIIAAGYPEAMERLLQADDGLRSRFTHHYLFENYTAPEMLEIFRRMASDGGLILGNGVEAGLLALFEKWEKNPPVGFANARTVRTTYEQVRSAMNNRLVETLETASDEAVNTILPEDVVAIAAG